MRRLFIPAIVASKGPRNVLGALVLSLALAPAACSGGTQPSAPMPTTLLGAGAYGVAVVDGGRSIELRRGDAPLLVLGTDAFQLGTSEDSAESVNLDPYILEAHASELVTYRSPTSIRARKHGEGVAIDLAYDDGFTARALVQSVDAAHAPVPVRMDVCDRIAEDGRPIQRPLGLMNPELGVHPSDAYFFGEELLVLPVVTRGERVRRGIVPAGTWIDWWDGTPFTFQKGFVFEVVTTAEPAEVTRDSVALPKQPDLTSLEQLRKAGRGRPSAGERSGSRSARETRRCAFIEARSRGSISAASATNTRVASSVGRAHVGVMRYGRTRTSRAALVAIALSLLLACLGRDAHADDAPSPPPHGGSPYRLRLAYDFSFLALGAAGSLTALIGYPPATCPNPCVPPQKQLGIDDHFVGTRSGGAMTAANVLLGVTLAAPVVLDAVDSRFHGFAEDVVVMGESLALATALTQVVKSATRRNAPLVFASNVRQSDLDNQDAARSFPSGHTAATFAVATSYAITFWKRNPHSPWRWVVLGVGQGLALTTGILTVAAGWHYPTDVAAGALTGGAMGVLMPFLHTDW